MDRLGPRGSQAEPHGIVRPPVRLGSRGRHDRAALDPYATKTGMPRRPRRGETPVASWFKTREAECGDLWLETTPQAQPSQPRGTVD